MSCTLSTLKIYPMHSLIILLLYSMHFFSQNEKVKKKAVFVLHIFEGEPKGEVGGYCEDPEERGWLPEQRCGTALGEYQSASRSILKGKIVDLLKGQTLDLGDREQLR